MKWFDRMREISMENWKSREFLRLKRNEEEISPPFFCDSLLGCWNRNEDERINTDSWEWGSKRTWKSDVRSSIGFASFPPSSMLCSVRLTNKVLSTESFLLLLLFAGSVWQHPRGFEDPRRSHYSYRLVATQNITVLFCIINFDFNKSTDLKISRGKLFFLDLRVYLNFWIHIIIKFILLWNAPLKKIKNNCLSFFQCISK